jgi:hypothetical protein
MTNLRQEKIEVYSRALRRLSSQELGSFNGALMNEFCAHGEITIEAFTECVSSAQEFARDEKFKRLGLLDDDGNVDFSGISYEKGDL